MSEKAQLELVGTNAVSLYNLKPAVTGAVPFEKARFRTMVSVTSTHTCVEFLDWDHRPTGERFLIPHPTPDSQPLSFVVESEGYDGELKVTIRSAGAPVTAYGVSFDTNGTLVVD